MPTDKLSFAAVVEAEEERTQRAMRQALHAKSVKAQRALQQQLIIKTTKNFFDHQKLYLKSVEEYRTNKSKRESS